MWIYWILLLCATDISSGVRVEPQSVSVNAPTNIHEDHNVKQTNGDERIRRFACPVGFFRLKGNCYYLSAGVAQWREAYFHCKDRNSTLAVLDRNGKDRILRKYLMGDQFTKLERWIGGVYNWQQMEWKWGVSGEKIQFQNFAHINRENPKLYEWHCIVLDPSVKYKWSPRSCIKKKHYICEVPAGRIRRRRRKRIDDNLVPQNQRLKPKKHGKKHMKKETDKIKRRRNKIRRTWRQKITEQNVNQEWAHGVNLGSRPPAEMKMSPTRMSNKTRHHLNKIHIYEDTPKITQIVPKGYEYGAFLGDSPAKRVQSLRKDETVSNYHENLNDLSLEEVLLKV